MTARLAILALAIMLLLQPGGGMARDLTVAETRSLEASVREFDRAMRAQEFEVLIARSLPPRMLDHLARNSSMSVDQLRASALEVMAKTMATVKFESFAMDLAKAERRALKDGTPFVLIPSEAVMNVRSQGRVRSRSHTLGLMDGGAWYLVRVGSAQELTLLQQVYPGFAGVEFPRGTMETLK
jgi:hypothetical protein